MLTHIFSQSDFQIRFEWGIQGVRTLAPVSDVIVIVDVLSFSTCVDIAVSRQALVFPYRYKDDSAAEYATAVQAVLAGKRGEQLSLSPASLCSLDPHARIVLPSPNGSTCTVEAKAAGCTVIAGCLRNATAVASFLQQRHGGAVISVIACGEHWETGELRPAIEDVIGAGAILGHFEESRLSPEARIAVAAYHATMGNVADVLQNCGSGRELIARGFPEDVDLAAEVNVSQTIPILQDGAYVRVLLS